MLTRVYVDNFRCFVNFEYKPGRRDLILGANGSGKTSLVDVLLLLRNFAADGAFAGPWILFQRTRWMEQARQTAELEFSLPEGRYRYRLVVEPWGEPPRPRVVSETVELDQRPIFEFLNGEVHLYNDRFEHKVTYEFDWFRGALATIIPRRDNAKLTRFKQAFANLLCFRINPFGMQSRAEMETPAPDAHLSNIASWYRHLVQTEPAQNAALLESLRDALDGFRYLQLEPAGENVRLLAAEFADDSGRPAKFYLHELSDGQRCLICLYTILQFLVAKGCTVLLDEPDNFLSVREIQPFLTALSDAVQDGTGQVLLISHHPEALNQWAPENGVRFFRDGVGPVRVVPFRGDPERCLSPSELIARGWERE